ncbi:unnamed protein product [Closterium sp. Yama58-4]|nr:unnamed protein product [Closterium sp. Yama58-4]
MECQLSGEQIRGLCRAVQCLAKVAHSDYITFLAAPVELSLRGINTAKTAYLVVNFATDYFQTFKLTQPTCSCSALVKSVLAVFRTAPAAMQTLTITADGKEPDNIHWIIDCHNGMRKTYTIACVNDREVLSASIDPSTYPSSLVARPKALLQLLNHFQSTLSEITIIAADPEDVTGSGTGTGGGAAGRGGGSEAKAVEMRSYVEPTHAGSSADGRLEASPEAAMHTQLWVDPGEHFEAYCHRGDAVDVTFSVKEVKAFVQFCESAAADVVMLFHQAGASPLPHLPTLPFTEHPPNPARLTKQRLLPKPLPILALLLTRARLPERLPELGLLQLHFQAPSAPVMQARGQFPTKPIQIQVQEQGWRQAGRMENDGQTSQGQKAQHTELVRIQQVREEERGVAVGEEGAAHGPGRSNNHFRALSSKINGSNSMINTSNSRQPISVDGNGMVTGGAADVSAGRFMPTEASTPGRQALHQRQDISRAEAPPLQRDPDRWIENTEDDETEDRLRGRVGGLLGEDQCEGVGDEDEYVDATPPERRMYDDEDETMD